MATEAIKVQKRVAVKCYKAGNMSQHRRDGFITKSSNHKMQNNNKSELLNAKVFVINLYKSSCCQVDIARYLYLVLHGNCAQVLQSICTQYCMVVVPRYWKLVVGHLRHMKRLQSVRTWEQGKLFTVISSSEYFGQFQVKLSSGLQVDLICKRRFTKEWTKH